MANLILLPAQELPLIGGHGFSGDGPQFQLIPNLLQKFVHLSGVIILADLIGITDCVTQSDIVFHHISDYQPACPFKQSRKSFIVHDCSALSFRLISLSF